MSTETFLHTLVYNLAYTLISPILLYSLYPYTVIIHLILLDSEREYLNFSGIPNTVPPKELASFVIHALEEIGIKLNKSQIFHLPDLGSQKEQPLNFQTERC